MHNIGDYRDLSNLSMIYNYHIKIKTQLLYTSFLIAILVSLCLLPFIKIDVNVKSSGILQPLQEKAELFIPVNGIISYTKLKENLKVEAGDTLFKIDATLYTKQSHIISTRERELSIMLRDISVMAAALSNEDFINKNLTLSNPHYASSWQQFIFQLKISSSKKEQAEREFKRYKILFDQKVLSASEFEKTKAMYDQAVADYEYLIRFYQSQWQSESNQYKAELNDVNQKRVDWQDQQKYYTFIAPVSGSLQNIKGIHEGTHVHNNQKIAEISPDSIVVAVCFVTPNDIGLIKKGQKVRLMVDAFNYNQWGVLEAGVIDIADDVLITANNNPVFKVKCQLNRTYMQLSNGYKGYLKKGMTFRASFFVARRSLFQLLYDKADDWLNPNTVEKANL